jgi:hypothetical protein
MNSPRADYYCYALLDTRKPGVYSYDVEGVHVEFLFEPFYIGKGLKNRIAVHIAEAKSLDYSGHRHNKIRKIWESGLAVGQEKIKIGLTEREALSLEEMLIRTIGRIELYTGPLVNHTSGGEGVSGRVVPDAVREKQRKAATGRKASEATREKMRIAQTGKTASDEARAKMREAKIGVPRSASVRQKMSATRSGEGGTFFGKTHSDEAKKKMSDRAKNRIPLVCPHCGKSSASNFMRKHHFDACKTIGVKNE